MSAVLELPNLSDAEEIELLSLLEAERRDDARESLAEFVRSVDVPGVPATEETEEDEYYPIRVEPAQHHLLLIDALERVERGEIRRLMVLMPPGSGKSTYASVAFPAWFLGRKGRRNLICASYGSNLPLKFGRRTRNLVASEEYRQIFGVTLARDSKAADSWALSNGSDYMSAGILAGITGHRADGLLIEDPIKNREDADSVTIREKVWEEYRTTLRTRLKPHGWIALIQTRWHEQDLAGRILPETYAGETGWITAQDGERWYVLCIQAECERADDPLGREMGQFYWPEWFPPEHLAQEKITQGPRNWSALYQQTPQPESGDYFKKSWFRYYDWKNPPAHLVRYAASDYATKDGAGDYTVHGIVGNDPNDDLYVLDWWREQVESPVWVEAAIDLMEKHYPIAQWGEESDQIDRSVGPFLLKRMLERKVYCNREQYSSSKNKREKARSFQARMAMGKVYFPKDAPWMPALESELLRFDSGVHDDQVDVLGLFGRMLDEMRRGRAPKKPEPPRGLTIADLDRQRRQRALGIGGPKVGYYVTPKNGH